MQREPADAPARLRVALATEPRIDVLSVGGVHVRCRVWEPRDPGAATRLHVLVHGTAARSEWWDGIAPLLARRALVVAPDLTGHGGSEWRPRYDLESWADEALAVVDRYAAGRHTQIAGHSLGGLVALVAAWRRPQRFGDVVLLDTPFRRLTAEQRAKRTSIANRPLPRYTSLEAAVAAFRTVPALVRPQRELVAHVARRSFRRDGEEWVLHVDPRVYERVTDVDAFLRPLPPGASIVRAEHGLIDDRMAEGQRALLTDPDRLRTLPGVGHHVVLEAPSAVARLLSDATPRGRGAL